MKETLQERMEALLKRLKNYNSTMNKQLETAKSQDRFSEAHNLKTRIYEVEAIIVEIEKELAI